jgi:hypothetical protein
MYICGGDIIALPLAGSVLKMAATQYKLLGEALVS